MGWKDCSIDVLLRASCPHGIIEVIGDSQCILSGPTSRFPKPTGDQKTSMGTLGNVDAFSAKGNLREMFRACFLANYGDILYRFSQE